MARGAAGRPSGLPAAPTRDWFVPWRTGKQIRNCCPPPLTKSWPAPVRYANFSVGPLVAPYPWTHVQGRWNEPQMGGHVDFVSLSTRAEGPHGCVHHIARVDE